VVNDISSALALIGFSLDADFRYLAFQGKYYGPVVIPLCLFSNPHVALGVNAFKEGRLTTYRLVRNEERKTDRDPGLK
jgi:hypothetical protein